MRQVHRVVRLIPWYTVDAAPVAVGPSRGGLRRLSARAVAVAAAVATAGLVLPGGVGNAAPAAKHPTLKNLVSEASRLSNQIDSEIQQADGLKIQLSEARAEAAIAKQTAARDAHALSAGQLAVGELAAESYMSGGLVSPLQILTSGDPGAFISRGSIMLQLQQESSDRLSSLVTAEATARRARETAEQEERTVTSLQGTLNAKAKVIQSKISEINSAAFAKAMTVFDQTGQYPNLQIPTANTVGAEALRYALTRRGDPYVWGGAGPGDFDCSGLVVWAYAQIGISLPHYTGSLWNSGEHVSQSQLEPGDLVFFFADISHVGIYIGNGLMVDAPTFGEPVQVQPVFWSAYVGAVRIVA